MNKYKVCWVVLCKNEMDILPYVTKYWERIATKVIVFDNGSTDGSIEYLSQLPYVELRHFESDGHNDIIQKTVKEQAYREVKDNYDFIIITDMDEVFYFEDFEALGEQAINEGCNIIATPICTLCEDKKPQYEEGKLLHQQCGKFYVQRMNHMKGYEKVSKLSIFNTKTTDVVAMSVGQHYVQTYPSMKVLISDKGFCLHINKGFGEDYFVQKRKKMGENLSFINRRNGMGVEYLDSEEKMRQEYRENQAKSFDIN